jgi:hypothetical protein
VLLLVPDWLNWTADIASIAALFVSLAVLYQARTIRKSFEQRARFPELLKGLQTASTRLSGVLGIWPQEQNDALIEMERIRSLLLNVRAKLARADRRDFSSLARRLRARRGWRRHRNALRELTYDEAWDIYTDVLGRIEWLGEYQKDLRWR